jgi:hypothetical protein
MRCVQLKIREILILDCSYSPEANRRVAFPKTTIGGKDYFAAVLLE